MSAFEVEFPDDILSGLLETDSQKLCEEMLREAAPLMVEAMKKNVTEAMGEYSTGEAVDSIRATKPKKAKNGAFITNIRPTGYSNHTYTRAGQKVSRKYKVSNALKLIWKEYGIPGHQPARPFLTRTINTSQKSILAKMQETYERMTKK